MGLSIRDRAKQLMRTDSLKVDFAMGPALGHEMLGALDLDDKDGHDVAVGPSVVWDSVGVMALSGVGDGGPDLPPALWSSDWSHPLMGSGVTIAPYGKMDADGTADVLVGSSDWFWRGSVHADGTLRLLSGRTGDELWAVTEERYGTLLWPTTEPE